MPNRMNLREGIVFNRKGKVDTIINCDYNADIDRRELPV